MGIGEPLLELKSVFKEDEEVLNDGPAEIVMKDVYFGYDEDSPVISDINITISDPGLYCIVGPNGVGKSTLIKCMCKMLNISKGEVLINGRNIKEMKHKDVAKYIGYVPVSTGDVFSMSVLETILVGCQNKNDSDESKMRAVYKSMSLMNIVDLSGKNFSELSAGQHQKVAIARGLVQRPKILILDEPTANLDVKYQVYVTELLRALAEHEKMIVLMISHDLNTSAKYAHKVIMMAKPGVIHQIGDPEEVITKENVEKVYGVHCKIIQDDDYGVPIVVLGQSMMDEDGNIEVDPGMFLLEELENGKGSREINSKVLGRIGQRIQGRSEEGTGEQEHQR